MRRGVFLTLAFLALAALIAGASARRTETPAPRAIIVSKSATTSDRPLAAPVESAAVSESYILADFTFDPLDAEGWTSHDATQQDTFFHIDDFAGLPPEYVPLEGAQSLWCGTRQNGSPELCNYATLPGYGNHWSQVFGSVAFAVTGDVTISYKVSWDSEYANYDITELSYEDVNGGWVRLPVDGGKGWYDWIGELDEALTIDAASIGDSIRFRFDFRSDGAWSDEDGLWPTNGAIVIDSLVVRDSTGILDYQDFETEALGAFTTSDGDWQARPFKAYGDFAGLYAGTDVLQEYRCASNYSGMWGFFNGSTATYACGGHPEQPAVPFWLPAELWWGALYIENEIWSPIFDYENDIDGSPVPPTASSAILEFDVYRDLPLDNLMFYRWYVRGVIDGCPTPWRDRNYVYWGGDKDWFRERQEVGDLIDAGSTGMQVSLACIDMCAWWCNIYGTATCHSHAPLFDNVRVTRVNTIGPVWVVEAFELFQDNFAEDGTTTGTVRMDAARDIRNDSPPPIVPRDDVTVTVSERNVGIDLHWTGGPAVFCHVKDVSPAKSGGALSGDPSRYPAVGTGDGWTVLRFDTLYNSSGDPVPDRFSFDLADRLFTPGDTIYYYYSARDANGNVSYWSVLAGTTASEDEVRAFPNEVTCLPANALSGATDILYVDDADGYGAQPYFDDAFRTLGITPDRYDVLAPASLVSNGPGSRVVDVVAQLSSCYRKIIWNSGALSAGLISDGTTATDKSDDFTMLIEFLHQSPDGAGLYISGDNVAEEWAMLTGTSAIALRSFFMNFYLAANDHVWEGEPISPLAIAQPGSCFDHERGPDTLIAYGGCPSLARFDVLGQSGASTIEMAYSDDPAHGALLGQISENAAGDTARVLLSGFSYHHIRDDRLQTPIDRVEHLLDILRWLDNSLPHPTGVPDGAPLVNSLAQNYPNPFNPVTTIHYSIEQAGHVSLRVYDIAGRLVRTLVDERQAPRADGFSVEWDGRTNGGNAVASGIYFYRLTTADYHSTRKMVLLK